MSNLTKSTIFSPEAIDEQRDLRNVLLFGILTSGVLASLAIVGVPTKILQIPLFENVLTAFIGAVISALGLMGLQFNYPPRQLAWAALMSWTVIMTIGIHLCGGPQTPLPAVYVLIVVAASFLLGRNGALVVALWGLINYAVILALEYYGVLKMVEIWNMPFEPEGRELLLVVNLLTVAAPSIGTAFLGGTLASRLRNTNLGLLESERLRESLSGMIVHDLRNPMTALLGGLDILRITLSEHLDDEQKHLLENARHSGHSLLGMVNELLDISKMEAGKLALNIQMVDMCVLVSESIDLVRALTEVEELEIRTALCDDVKQVPCDRQLISRVVANLLSNAIKHTPSGGTISVIARQVGSNATVSVADTGPGISPEYHKLIFEKFGQVEKRGQERRGTGLGLTFCKMAIEAHNGQIWVESEVGQGSTFCFSLPMDTPLTVAEAAVGN